MVHCENGEAEGRITVIQQVTWAFLTYLSGKYFHYSKDRRGKNTMSGGDLGKKFVISAIG